MGEASGSAGREAAGPVAPALTTDAGPATLTDEATPAADRTLTGLGVDPTTPVTLLQFSSAFCAPCRATRRVLADVAGLVDGVTHLEVDAESHLDAVRALGIWRTPTTLVVAGGQVVQRASGVPAKAQVLAAIAPMLDRAA
jgi:thiol-disulfide isomerase/thioredoxin